MYAVNRFDLAESMLSLSGKTGAIAIRRAGTRIIHAGFRDGKHRVFYWRMSY